MIYLFVFRNGKMGVIRPYVYHSFKLLVRYLVFTVFFSFFFNSYIHMVSVVVDFVVV